MKTRRIVGTLTLGAAAATMAFVPGAGAQTTETTYAGTAGGDALRLALGDQELTVGRTTSGLDSTLSAVAEGVGLATPLVEAGVSTAKVVGEGVDGSEEEICEAVVDQLPAVTIDLACSSSVAHVTDGLPGARATGRVGSITVGSLDALTSPLSEIPVVGEALETGLDEAEAVLDTVVGELATITGPVDETLDLGVQDTLQDLVDSLFGGAELVSVDLGTTIAEDVVGADLVTATCSAAAGRIDILDVPATGAADPEPFVSLVIGSATTSVEASLIDGTATPTVDPAIVTVIVPSLDLEVPVGPGERLEIEDPTAALLGEGLIGDIVIAGAAGTTGTDDAGQTFATADAVLISLFNGGAIGESLGGPLELSLGNCTSVAGAVAPVQVTTTTTEPVPQLPRTGSDDTAALAAAVGLAGLGLVLLRRTGANG